MNPFSVFKIRNKITGLYCEIWDRQIQWSQEGGFFYNVTRAKTHISRVRGYIKECLGDKPTRWGYTAQKSNAPPDPQLFTFEKGNIEIVEFLMVPKEVDKFDY